MSVKINQPKRRSLRPFWHPYQGLWNWELLGMMRRIFPVSPLYSVITKTIVSLDTVVLFLRAFARRIQRVRLTGVVDKDTMPDDVSILYFDLGTHKEARELTLMVDTVLQRMASRFTCCGFEASHESFEQAQSCLNGRKEVLLIHKALCNELPAGGKVRLYKDLEHGIGDSLFRRTETYEEVEAMRFPDWINENNIDVENNICILRMNIEGAEYEVVRDLVNSGLAGYTDGYYGMWDDVSKNDQQHDEKFRAFLAENQISPFTFNGRDLVWPLRIRCIEYDIKTSIKVGLQKIRNDVRRTAKNR